jgi:hypothetical protein
MTLNGTMADIASAIREKTGKEDKIAPVDFAKEIQGISVGVPINNQDKNVDITENGTIEVMADSGYTGLGKVTINTEVSGGGGSSSDIPVIGDGKTYLYIKIAAPGRTTVPLHFYQSVANGVTIDWGDGSATQTLSGTGNINTTHTYADVGDSADV